MKQVQTGVGGGGGVVMVWTEPESAELWPPDQLTCCPLRRCSLYRNLKAKHKHHHHYCFDQDIH